MKNSCNYDIEVAWCYQGGDCKYGNWGASNQGTVLAGAEKSASTLVSRSSRLSIHYIACKGRNSYPVDTSATSGYCKY